MTDLQATCRCACHDGIQNAWACQCPCTAYALQGYPKPKLDPDAKARELSQLVMKKLEDYLPVEGCGTFYSEHIESAIGLALEAEYKRGREETVKNSEGYLYARNKMRALAHIAYKRGFNDGLLRTSIFASEAAAGGEMVHYCNICRRPLLDGDRISVRVEGTYHELASQRSWALDKADLEADQRTLEHVEC